MARYLWLPTDGSPARVEDCDAGDLAVLQALVGGYIQTVPFVSDDEPAAVLVCNEDGAYLPGCLPNPAATTLADGRVLMPSGGMVGAVAIFGDSDEGELVDVPEWVVTLASQQWMRPEGTR